MQYSISFVGAGRVAGIMCREIYLSGYKIDTVISLSEANGRELANDCKASWTNEYIIPDSTDVVIVSVPDSQLKSVLGKLKFKQGTIIAHTAGSSGLDVFPPEVEHKGVIYPLQTFSKNRKVKFTSLPVFIESSDNSTSEALSEIAGSVGSKVYFADTEHRRKLHLAAVFACNFTNHMMTLGKKLAYDAGYSFDELKPLIEETFLKAFEKGPENSQTGPAVRNDKNTVRKHLELLSFDHDLQRIYSEISGSIFKYYNRK
ncbi:MAG TPA: Rossmann-like and DUF2520 domain-containing protein [Bacteroidales bacterium]|nr:Rossmann-like and DUF2520 domain-containing protein [Bacteroidales bacterium]